MKIKTLIAAFALAITPMFASAAVETDCSNFAVDMNGGDGGVVGLGAGAFDCAFTITSSNVGGGFVETSYTATATSSMAVDGVWTYSTQDIDGSSYDVFGIIINGVKSQLSVDGIASPAIQNGTFAFSVMTGDVFGWYMDATDDILGSADADVYANFSPVPLPAGGLLLIGGLGGLAALRRRKKA